MKPLATVNAQPASLQHEIVRHQAASVQETEDLLVVEEPLEIQLKHKDGQPGSERAISITMRTPGQDAELAIGFLLGEGIIQSHQDVVEVKHCGPPSPDKGFDNVIQVVLQDEAMIDDSRLSRNFYTTSSCGVCGKTSIEAVNVAFPDQESQHFKVSKQALTQLPERLRQWQTEFNRTGGIHASATFNTSGEIQRVREDVGRHNALDKLIGSYFFEEQNPLSVLGLLLSGRASFELLQKSAMAQMPLIASIGPPSNLAVELAQERNITLIGFLKETGFNVYTKSHDIH